MLSKLTRVSYAALRFCFPWTCAMIVDQVSRTVFEKGIPGFITEVRWQPAHSQCYQTHSAY
jgi:hypothetical protein